MTKGTEKNPAGPIIVVGMLVVAAVGAGLTWRTYAADHPGARSAELVDAATARAEFDPAAASRIRPGTRAIVSRDGVRSTALVLDAPRDGAVRLRLLQPFPSPVPGSSVEVTVDLSIPPELLKDPTPVPDP